MRSGAAVVGPSAVRRDARRSVRRAACAALACGLLGSAVGCDASARRGGPVRFEGRTERFAGVTAATAFDAAEFALRQWFRVDQSRPDEGLLTTFPSEYDERGGTGRIRDDAVRFPNRLRRTATVRVRSTADGAAVECVVKRERLDTSDHRVFAHARTFDDLPNQTPITAEAATTPRKNEVWTDLGRDRALEMDILRTVRERLADQTPTPIE